MSSAIKVTDTLKIRRALISVSDKTDVAELAQVLHSLGVQILSTGGTAQLLKNAGIPVTSVSDYTGFPELMDGRLKTLHPKIHGGILGRGETDQDEMKSHEITPIDLVVVNLYPFEQVSSNPNSSVDEIIENIDIGGPAMIRAAAKNFAHTCVVVDPDDYSGILEDIANDKGIGIETRRRLALKAFTRTAQYDTIISNYMAEQNWSDDQYPATLNLTYKKQLEMRYGENPHQSAAFYLPATGGDGWYANSSLLQGKPMSFNNMADADAAFNAVAEFDDPACVIIKHATPCGVATSENIASAYELAYKTDPISAFGGVIAFNRPLDQESAQAILSKQFVEVILAPSIDASALEILSRKQNIRVLEHSIKCYKPTRPRLSSAGGGLLIQSPDSSLLPEEGSLTVSNRQPSDRELEDMLFAWKVAKHVKSNAIVYAKDCATFGIGAGQMSRVDSAQIAASKAAEAGLDLHNAVMASDAFFPFRDGIDKAAAAGIRAVIQPGGSQRDEEVIAAANEHDIAMLFTGMRHFRH